MTVKKLFALMFIFLMTTIAWMILGASNLSRTDSSYSSLKSEVANLYGGDLVFKTPQCYTKQARVKEELIDGRLVVTEYTENEYLELVSSDIEMHVVLDQRKKGNLWFPTFRTAFTGSYVFRAEDARADDQAYLYSTLDSTDSIYNNIALAVNGAEIEDVIPLIRKQEMKVRPDRNGLVSLKVSYDVSGMEELRYYITEDSDEIAQINDFHLAIFTDFDTYDFPSNMMSPTLKTRTDGGWKLEWDFNKSVTGKDIGLVIPNRVNPGQIITRVSFFAPVSLLFFFIVILMLSVVLKLNLHPMHYFFLAATFFSFHLMFSYFSDQMNIYLSFAVASAVSLFLTVSYLRIVTPGRMATVFAPLTQAIYLVVFSFSFFFEGMTGIIVTVCAVVTLFLLMQLTAKTRWDTVFSGIQSGTHEHF